MQRLFRSALPWGVFALALLLTVVGGYQADMSQRAAVARRFENTVKQIDWHLRQRFLEYEQMLRGGAGLFMASEEVTRAEWKRYVDHLFLSASYPGIQGVGFAKQTLPGERASLVTAMRETGLIDFHIRPEGEREIYYPIVYLEPLDWRNQRAIGYDMFAEATRNAAMTRCRDEGITTLSGRVELVQEVEKGKQAGFLLYLPLYERGKAVDTPEQRRAAFLGFVYSPFRMGDFMSDSFSGSNPWIPDGELVELSIFDGERGDESRLMFASERFDETDTGLVKEETLPLYGHHWTIRVAARPAFLKRYGEGFGAEVYVVGAFLCLLLFGLAIRAERRREREDAEGRFRSLVATVPGAVYACQNDERWTIDFVSPHIIDITGYPAADFLAPQRVRHFGDLIVPEDREMVFRKVQAGVQKEAPYQLEYRIRNAEGKIRWIGERGRGVFDVHGKLDHLTGVIFDVTEQKRAEEELRKAKETAEGATRVKDQFVSLVAHDLRSPFAAIVGTMRALRTDGADCMRPEMAELVDSVIQSGERMSHMIEELLDITRLQTGKIVPRPRFFDARDAAAASLAAVGFQATAKGIALANHVPPGIRLYADPQLLHEALQNILGNGVKFLSAGETITLSANPVRPLALLVEDNGPGIPPEFLPNLFRHEVKTSSHGSAGEAGTGLGLPYAHDLMEAMGGELDAEPAEGGGARFRLSFPVVKPVVLLVDDETAVRMLLAALLRELEVETVEAAGGAEALRIMAERPVHCVITDLNMPEMDGFTLLREIKEKQGKEGPPVVVVTADHSMETRVKIIRAGADDFLTKPVDKNDLIPRLRRFLS